MNSQPEIPKEEPQEPETPSGKIAKRIKDMSANFAYGILTLFFYTGLVTLSALQKISNSAKWTHEAVQKELKIIKGIFRDIFKNQ